MPDSEKWPDFCLSCAMANFNLWFYERAIRRERVFKDRSNPLEVLSEKELFEKLRFPRHAIQQLAFDLEEQLRPETSRNCSIPPLLQICLALRFFATGCFINAAADVIGVHKSTASRIIHRVSCVLSGRLPLYPTDVSTLNKVKVDFFDIAGFPNVIGPLMEHTLGFKHLQPMSHCLSIGKATTVLMCRQSVMPNSECSTVLLAGQDQPMTHEF